MSVAKTLQELEHQVAGNCRYHTTSVLAPAASASSSNLRIASCTSTRLLQPQRELIDGGWGSTQILCFLIYVKPKLNLGLFLHRGLFEGEAMPRKRAAGGNLGWQRSALPRLRCGYWHEREFSSHKLQAFCFRSVSVGEGEGHVLQNGFLCLFCPFKTTKILLV